MNLSPEEMTHVEAARLALKTAKEAMRDAMTAMTAMMDIQRAAKRTSAYNAAYRARATFRAQLASIEIAHADASKSLDDEFEDGGVVIFGGGGR